LEAVGNRPITAKAGKRGSPGELGTTGASASDNPILRDMPR